MATTELKAARAAMSLKPGTVCRTLYQHSEPVTVVPVKPYMLPLPSVEWLPIRFFDGYVGLCHREMLAISNV